MHEVAADAQRVDPEDQPTAENEGDNRPRRAQKLLKALPQRACGLICGSGRCVRSASPHEQQRTDEQEQQRQPEQVRPDQVPQVSKTLRPLRATGVLRHRGVRVRQGVIAHSPDLIAHRDKSGDDDDQCANLPGQACGENDHHQRGSTGNRHLGSNQWSESGHERESQDRRRGRRRRLRPPNEQYPQERDPEDHQASLEPGSGEISRRRNRDVDENTRRYQQDRSARRRPNAAVQTTGAEHRQHDGSSREY